MSKREPDRTALTRVGSTAVRDDPSRPAPVEASERCLSCETQGGFAPDLSDQQEALEIALDLIADLGAGDALSWADEYMVGLHGKGDWRGMQRWGIVVSALAELAGASVH